MNLHACLLKAIKKEGYEHPTEIQAAAIPVVLEGRDLMASAQTGSGKTAAFVLPALQRLIELEEKESRSSPKVLVLTPTRELAGQVTEVFKAMGQQTAFKIGVITGGMPYPAQERMLRGRVDFLVATPGRLIDHLGAGRVNLSQVQLLILDEADRMLDMGFMEDIERILEPISQKRQIVLFSATLDGEVQKVAKRLLNNPVCIQLNKTAQPPKLIEQRLHQADDFKHKRELLLHLLQDDSVWQAIVFSATKRGTERLADELDFHRISCDVLHGDMKQSKRSRTLDRMRMGQTRVLVATDVAARGIDVKGISHVVNFDLPRSAEDYVHRIGRTGRCGEAGIAISLVGPDEWAQIAAIERFTGQRLERHVIEGLEPTGQEPSLARKSFSKRRGPPQGQGRGRSSGGYSSGGAQRRGARSEGNRSHY